jgi:hypothetical protein
LRSDAGKSGGFTRLFGFRRSAARDEFHAESFQDFLRRDAAIIVIGQPEIACDGITVDEPKLF